MCDNCKGDERFVYVDLNMSINMPGVNAASINYAALPDNAAVKANTKVKCKHCHDKFDGCSKCGVYGNSCTGCDLTHILHTPTVTPPAVAV